MVDGKFRALLAAFAAAPALTELHVQLPDHLGLQGSSLVCVHVVAPSGKWSCHTMPSSLESTMTLMTWQKLLRSSPHAQICS